MTSGGRRHAGSPVFETQVVKAATISQHVTKISLRAETHDLSSSPERSSAIDLRALLERFILLTFELRFPFALLPDEIFELFVGLNCQRPKPHLAIAVEIQQ